MIKGYTGYKIRTASRKRILAALIPIFKTVDTHHITVEFGVNERLPQNANVAKIIAVAHNEKIHTAIVEVKGSTIRPDGNIYHITISYDKDSGARPVDSNELIHDESNWNYLSTPIWIDIIPTFYPFRNSNK